MANKIKYHKPLRILAETHGMSLSRLEFRLSSGMSLEDALTTPLRSREVTRNDLLKVQNLTFTQACKMLGISTRKLNRLAAQYSIYFKRDAYRAVEIPTLFWICIHSPALTYKGMAKWLLEQTGLNYTDAQVSYLFSKFGLTLKIFKSNQTYLTKLAYNWLWSTCNESNQS